MIRGASNIENDSGPQDKTFRNRMRLEGKWHPGEEDASDVPDTAELDYYVLASVESDYLWFGPDDVWDDYSMDLYVAGYDTI